MYFVGNRDAESALKLLFWLGQHLNISMHVHSLTHTFPGNRLWSSHWSKGLFLSSFSPCSAYYFSSSLFVYLSHLCSTTPIHALPGQAEPFLIHCFCLFAFHSANHRLPPHSQIPSKMFSLTSPNIPFTRLPSCLSIFFLSSSSCYYPILKLFCLFPLYIMLLWAFR